jgi:hypothetical protein
MPESLPTSPGYKQVTTRFVSNSATYSSPITGASQVAARFGGVWEIEIQLPPMDRRQAGAWLGLMTKLNGPSTSVYVGPHAPRPVDYYDPNVNTSHPQSASLCLHFRLGEYALRWVDAPTPLIDGGSQTGSTLLTYGWSDYDGLNAGDYLAFENGTFRELHIVTADCFANTSGEIDIPIAPPIRRSPSDNAAIILVKPTGEFIAADQGQANEVFDGAQGIRNMTVTFREFLR